MSYGIKKMPYDTIKGGQVLIPRSFLRVSSFSSQQCASLSTHAFRGSVFETWAVSELLKGRLNRGLKENLYFWRDNTGHEIDCIIENGDQLLPLEIKSGKTINRDFFKGLKYWSKISKTEGEKAYLVYGGSMDQKRKDGHVLGWKSFAGKIPLIA